MEKRTTIAIPTYVRDRLRLYGRKAETYEGVLQRLMDLVSPEEFLEAEVKTYTRTFTNAEVREVRNQSVEDRLRLAEEMRLLVLAVEATRKRPRKQKGRKV